MSRTLSTKKTKKKKKVKRRSSDSTEGSYKVSKSPEGSSSTAKEAGASKPSEMSKKAQCDLCKLSYSTEKELTEHLVSIMHHTKMEDKEEKPVHSCTLCSVTCSNMADYRVHVTTDTHQRKLSSLKGVDKNHVNKKGKQPPWWKKQTYSHKSKHGVFNGYNKQSGDTHKIAKFQGVSFTSQSHYDNRTSSRGFSFGQRHQNALFPYTVRANYWPREEFSNTGTFSETGNQRIPPLINNTRNTSDKNSQSGTQSVNQYPQPWGSGAYGLPHQYHSSEGISLPWKLDRRPQKLGTNFAHQKEVPSHSHVRDFAHQKEVPSHSHVRDFAHQKEVPSHSHVRDFASSSIPEAWDEQSLLQHEQFLASMDDVYCTGHQYPSEQLSTSNYNSERQRGPKVQDRKLLKRVDDQLLQDTFAKTSRSIVVSPVKEIPRRQPVPCISEERKYKAVNVQSLSFNIRTQIPNNSIHERAGHVSKELKETQCKAFQEDKNLLKSKHKTVGKEAVSLPHQQQPYHKGNPNMYRSQHSNISNPLTVKHSRHLPAESTASALQQSSNVNSLDDIRKSIEQSVLDNNKEPQIKTVSKVSRKRGSSESIQPAAASESKDMAGQSQSKRVCKPQLTKDSIKKIINAPNSRDERLQLSRMLQSRGEHKIAAPNILRTSVQLEGVHDSTVISESVNHGVNQNSSVQTIKLEDLSDSVRHQILSLIGEDIASFVGSQAELEVNKVRTESNTVKKTGNSNTHVIFLSDDEDVINAVDIKKNNSQKCSNNNTPEELVKNATKAKKKKIKIISEPVSKSGLYRSALPSVNRALMSASLSVKYSDNHETTKPTEILAKNQEEVLNADLSSCSSSMKVNRTKKLSGNKCVSDSVKTQLDKGKASGAASLSNEETVSCRQTDLLVGKNYRQMTNSFPTEELNTHVKSPSIRKKKVKTHKRDDSSDISSSNQCSKLTSHELPCHNPNAKLISSSTQRISESQQAHRKVKSTSKGAVVKSSTQMEVVSSSLHADTRLSPSLDARVAPSSIDTGSDSSLLLTTQQHSTETTRSLSSPHAGKSHPCTSNRLSLPPSTWLRDQISAPKESSSSSSLNASTCDTTSGLITVITDDEDDSNTESNQLPDNKVKDLTQLPGTEKQEGISLSDIFDDSKIFNLKPSLPLCLFKAEDKSEVINTVINSNNSGEEEREQLLDREVSNSTLSVSTLQRDSVSTTDTCNSNHSSSVPALPSVLKANKVEANSKMVTAVPDDEHDGGAGDKQLPDTGLVNEVSADVTEVTSEMVTNVTPEMVTTVTPAMVTTVIDNDGNSGAGCEQLPDSQANDSTLPVSTVQRDSISTANIDENSHSSSGPALPSVLKVVKMETNSEMVTAVSDDEDSGGAGDRQLPDSGVDNEVSADVAESSSNVMSELLMLSEREEDIKQEKMSLDLRLSRLHKLLEQAVLQINKCTDRRKQLHEEEQELARQRLSLLREAASLHPHKKSSTADTAPASSCDSEDRTHVSNTSQSVTQNLAINRHIVPYPAAVTSVVDSSTSENPQVASMSRDDWLAKFSSYLPCDGAVEDTGFRTRNLSVPSTLKEVFHCSSIPVASLSSLLPSNALFKEGVSLPSQTADYAVKTPQTVMKPAIDPSFLQTSQQCHSVSNKSDGSLQFQDVGSGQKSSGCAAPIRLLPQAVTMAPVVYLRSIKRADAVIRENTQTGSFSE